LEVFEVRYGNQLTTNIVFPDDENHCQYIKNYCFCLASWLQSLCRLQTSRGAITAGLPLHRPILLLANFDCKKNNASLTAHVGDVNLWGCEASPTYNENITRKQKELQQIEHTIAKIDKGLTSADLHSVINILSVRV
jgi:hypothetical protein